MTITCFYCKGEGWIRKIRIIPAGRVYGKPTQISTSSPCAYCHTTGQVTINTLADGKDKAANG